MKNIENEDTATIWEVGNVSATSGWTESKKFFLSEDKKEDYFAELKEEAIRERQDKMKELRELLEDVKEEQRDSEDEEIAGDKTILGRLDELKEELKLLRSDNYREKKIPLSSLGLPEFPYISEHELIK